MINSESTLKSSEAQRLNKKKKQNISYNRIRKIIAPAFRVTHFYSECFNSVGELCNHE